MGAIKKLKSILGKRPRAQADDREPRVCPGCGRPVVDHGDVCSSCRSREIDRMGH